MKQLYRKNEILFAIVWIVIYVVGAGVADGLSESIGIKGSITTGFLLALSLFALRFIHRQRLYHHYGLCGPDAKASRFLYYVPLIIIVSSNFWFGVGMTMPLMDTIFTMAAMVLVGFVEEVIFRGFLFRAMEKEGVTMAIVVSSLTFGIGHIINLISGNLALVPALCQVCYAAAAGFLFVIILYRGGSLWPCVLTHSALNALSVFSLEAAAGEGALILTSLIHCAIALGYALVLMKTLPKK
ncbi:MAG: CPBP family intramembrane metalloprotease [Clostridiales bacterium]|nr:CPBP family intramembrane metalloprotease [Clostridiales bacterium]